MVRTEADMIVNQLSQHHNHPYANNHHNNNYHYFTNNHNNHHHQDILYEISNGEELNPIHQEDDFGGEAYDEGMTYGQVHRRMANPNPNKKRGFSFPIQVRRRDTQVLTSIG